MSDAGDIALYDLEHRALQALVELHQTGQIGPCDAASKRIPWVPEYLVEVAVQRRLGDLHGTLPKLVTLGLLETQALTTLPTGTFCCGGERRVIVKRMRKAGSYSIGLENTVTTGHVKPISEIPAFRPTERGLQVAQQEPQFGWYTLNMVRGDAVDMRDRDIRYVEGVATLCDRLRALAADVAKSPATANDKEVATAVRSWLVTKSGLSAHVAGAIPVEEAIARLVGAVEESKTSGAGTPTVVTVAEMAKWFRQAGNAVEELFFSEWGTRRAELVSEIERIVNQWDDLTTNCYAAFGPNGPPAALVTQADKCRNVLDDHRTLMVRLGQRADVEAKMRAQQEQRLAGAVGEEARLLERLSAIPRAGRATDQSAAHSPPPPTMNMMEGRIVAELKKFNGRRITGEELAEAVKTTWNSHFRGVLSAMVRSGLLDNASDARGDGYGIQNGP